MDERNDIQNQIIENMQLKETDELLQIWKTNDRDAWSDEAFSAVEKILEQRLGTVPPQAEDAEDRQREEDIKIEEEDKTGKWLLWISSLAEALSYIALAFYIIAGVIPVIGTISLANAVLSVGAAVIMGLFFFVVLQFIAKAIMVLLDIRDYTGQLVEMKENDK